MTGDEIERELAGLNATQRQLRTALIFSAKESFYKLQHPLTGVSLGFHTVEVRIDQPGGRFEVTTRIATSAFLCGTTLTGTFDVKDGQVATLIWQR